MKIYSMERWATKSGHGKVFKMHELMLNIPPRRPPQRAELSEDRRPSFPRRERAFSSFISEDIPNNSCVYIFDSRNLTQQWVDNSMAALTSGVQTRPRQRCLRTLRISPPYLSPAGLDLDSVTGVGVSCSHL